MSNRVRRVEYFYAVGPDAPGQAYELLSALEQAKVNLLAFAAVPVGPVHAQLTLFPEEPMRLVRAAAHLGLTLLGPHHAFLVQGDDRTGALVDIHRRLCEAGINVYASNGIADGAGHFGYLLYVRADDFEHAAEVLGAGW
jgi:hypothetical protein